jgi:hypothetical protein
MRFLIILLAVQFITLNLSAQKMFDEEFLNCPLKFIMEDADELIYYETGDSLLVVDFLTGIEQKHIEKLKGVVMIQVMVDTINQVCCVSYSNKSTLNNNKLNIPAQLMNMKGWKRVSDLFVNENICTLVSIIFDEKEISVIHTGYNRNKGRNIMQSTTYKRYPEPLPVEQKDAQTK